MAPSLSLPPLDCGFGVKPSQADRSRAVRKADTSGSVAANTLAGIGPMPGRVCSRRAGSSASAARRRSAVMASMRSFGSRNCPASRSRGMRASGGRSAVSASATRRAMGWSPFGATTPNSRKCARSAFASWVNWRTRKSRLRCRISAACCASVLTGTKRSVGWVTAVQMASASAAAVFPRLTKGFT